MGDLIRVRLTGTFRDEEPDTYDRDPGCEVQFTDLDDPSVLKTARVTFANNGPCPWYAVMVHFYGTVQCTTGTMTVPGIGTYRTYTVNAADREAIVTALAIRSSDGTGLVCLEIPSDAVFHAVVLGRTQPERGDESLPGPAAAMTWGDWGSLPVPGNAWCRLALIAPDGSSYGSAMDGNRWVFGYYPTTQGLGGPGSLAFTEEHIDDAMPVLQFGANVLLTARRYDTVAEAMNFETRLAWHIVPGATAPATVVIARKGTDDYGLAYEEFLSSESYTRPVIVAWDYDQQRWAQATVVSSAVPPAFPDCTARSDRTLLGVCIGTNGSSGSVSLAQRFIVTEGRFWIDPATFLLIHNTPYFISNAAVVGSGSAGFWSETPCAQSCRRPVFFHHSDGWCSMAAQPGGPGQRFRYATTGSREAQIDAQSNRISYRDLSNSAELETEIGQETDETLAWFLDAGFQSRALVMKRGDLVVNIGGQDYDADTRGAAICFPYLLANRVTDTYTGPTGGWFSLETYDNGNGSGCLGFYDDGDEVMTWRGNTAGDLVTTGISRKFQWDTINVEITGGGSFRWSDNIDTPRLEIAQSDIDGLPAGFFNLARPLMYPRTIEVCDSENPGVPTYIVVLASENFA